VVCHNGLSACNLVGVSFIRDVVHSAVAHSLPFIVYQSLTDAQQKMAHQVLARKWRPRNFADVIGQEHVVRALANALDTGRIHHAYLFTGTRGVGKTTLARILSKALNCLGADGNGGMTSKPCGVCRSCTDIDAGRFVDLLEVDAATNTKVDEMRELLETAQYAPVSGRYKVYIIDEVHMLSKSAFNAMLKTLEEPPAHVEFILATTDPQKLPITVLSRCLQFNLKNLAPALLAEHLAKILTTEKIAFEQPALEMIGRAGEGSARDSLSLLDQAIAYGAGEVKTDNVAAMLGVLDQTYLFSMLEHLANADAKALLDEINRLAERSVSFELTLKDLAGVLARVALVQSAGAEVVEGPDASKFVAMAANLTSDDVQLFYQIALLGRRDLALAPDEQSGFTMTMLRMLAFKSSGAASGVVEKPVPVSKVAMPQGARSSETQPLARGSEAYPLNAAASKPPQECAVEMPANRGFSGGADQSFDGDWPAFVTQLNLTGMASMLAKQVEFRSLKGGLLVLGLAEASKHLADKAYQEKLKAELIPHFGNNLRMNIEIGAVAGASIAAVEDRARSAEQAAAEAAIDADPFIKNLQQDFGAEVNRASIRPAQS
jgi:DNA polymerase III subunit gamma/tau